MGSMVNFRARPRYRSADIYRPITRLADISYRPFSTYKLSAMNKNVLFTTLLINARFFGGFACAVAHTFQHENDALERVSMHTPMTTSRTFRFSEYMHINVWNKNIPNNCLRPLTWGQRSNNLGSKVESGVKDLGSIPQVKGRINQIKQFFVQPKAFEPLMLKTLNFQG